MHVSCYTIVWTILFLCFVPGRTDACHSTAHEPEEIYLELQVENLLRFDIDVFRCEETLYLPISDFLDHLLIDYSFSSDRKQLDIAFPDEDRPIRIDLNRYTIRDSDGTNRLDQQALLYPEERQEIHLAKELLEQIFSLDIHFDYNTLRLSLFSRYDLPVILNHRRQIRHDNFQRTKKNFTPDYEYSAQRNLLSGWVVDWSLNTAHNQYRQAYNYGFSTGGQLLGGDLVFSARGNASDGIRSDYLRGHWRYPIYSTPIVRQITAGDQIHENPFSRGTLQFRGFEITNSPNAPRQLFRNFTFSDRLQEGWDVELYSGNRMTDLASSTDDDYLFSFTEPLRYGSNRFTLRYYSPDGYSHEEFYSLTIPRSFLPPGQFEYSISAGNYRYDSSDFARAQLTMGVSPFLTLGGGYHARSSTSEGIEQTPYLLSFLQVTNRLQLEGRHTFGHISEGSLRYFFSSGRSLSAEIRNYYGSSRFNLSGITQEGSLNASFPLHLGWLNLSTFISARGTRYSNHRDLNLFGGFSTALPFGFLLQVRMRTLLRDRSPVGTELVRSDISVSASRRFLQRILLRPGLDYEHRSGRISGYHLEASSRLFRHGDFGVSVHRDLHVDQFRFQLNIRYNFPSARYHSSARMAGSRNPSFSQSASGSITLNAETGELHTGNRASTGKASLLLEPYLAIDELEGEDPVNEIAHQLEAVVYANGQRQPIYMEGNMINNLIPYENYIIQVSTDNLDNPLWKLPSNTFQIQVVPNVMNRLPVPVAAVGEVSGQVQLSNGGVDLRGIKIDLMNTDGDFSESVETYSNGQFYYVGLMPGNYKAVLDARQISDRSLNAVRDSVAFTIHATEQGDIVDGLTLEVTEEILDPITEIYMVQIGAFQDKANAAILADYIEASTNIEVDILYDPQERLYKCRIGYFDSEVSARNQLLKLQNDHFPQFKDAFIIQYDL